MFFNVEDRKGYTDVFFGFRLGGICPSGVPLTLEQALQMSSRFVRSIFMPEAEIAFELAARARRAADGGPTLALRVRVSHREREAAMAKADETAKALEAGLALWERYSWRALDKDGYRSICGEFAMGAFWEVRRRVKLIDHEAGKCAAPTGRHGLGISAFLPQPDPLGRVLRLLNRCAEGTTVSVAISPARYTQKERSFLDAQRKALGSRTEDDCDGCLPDFRLKALQNTLLRAEYAGENPFLLRVYVVAAETLPALTVNGLACALAAPGVPSDCAGGFELRCFENARESAAAAENLRSVRFTAPAADDGGNWGRLAELVSAEEAAGLFRFPAGPCPGVERARPSVPFCGKPEAHGTLIGSVACAADGAAAVRLSHDARLRHVYICGQTGTGKSSLMLSMLLQDIAEGHGVCLLDPHGDLYEHVLERLPAGRRGDVLAFNCGARAPGLRLNLLEHASETERDRIVESFLEIFGQLFDLKAVGGPIFEMYFRSALTLVMCDPNATLADFARFFHEKDYRSFCIGLCKDPFVAAAWEKIAAAAGGEMSLQNVAPYVVSKLSSFLFNRQLRAMVACRESTLDFSAAIKERKIVVVNLGKGVIGNLSASFIGMLLLEKLLRAAMDPRMRADKNFYLYADEFQNLATPGFVELLSEARKYRLGAVLANQFLGQLPPPVLRAALGNAGNLLCMRVGPEDACLLEEHFQAAFDKSDLLALPVGAAAASILSGGEKPRPFLLATANGLAGAGCPAAEAGEGPEPPVGNTAAVGKRGRRPAAKRQRPGEVRRVKE